MNKRVSTKLLSKWRRFFGVFLILFVVFQLTRTVLPRLSYYTDQYYTEATYKNLELLYNNSQYRQKNPSALIPDETLFGYVSGALLRGTDPILVNSEHTPLGKYFIALSILLLKNDRFIVVPFAIFCLGVLWWLSKSIFHDWLLALVPVVLLSSEQLFLDQLRYAPLLDIIQLPFVLLAFAFFLTEEKQERFFFTPLVLGFVAATKTVVPALLLVFCFSFFLILKRKFIPLMWFFIGLPIALGVLLVSYTRTFLNGYSLLEFFRFQKWIFLYQRSKLLYPFSVWRLIYFNQWQTWWGDFSLLKAADWQITWPIFTTVALVGTLVGVFRKWRIAPGVLLLFIWTIVYSVFLSVGVISSRFLLPFLPIVFIIGVYLLQFTYDKKISHK